LDGSELFNVSNQNGFKLAPKKKQSDSELQMMQDNEQAMSLLNDNGDYLLEEEHK